MATPNNNTPGPSIENEIPTCVFPEFADVNQFSQQALRAVLQATKSSNDLPVGDDFEFYSTFRSVRDVMDIEGRRILSLIQRLLRHQGVKGSLRHGDSTELDDKFDILMDINDQMLERVGSSLDEASGIRKEETKLVVAAANFTPSKSATSWNNKKSTTEPGKAASAYRLLTARNIQRPQLRFRDKVDNTSNPFRPTIRAKPHAIIPLEESLHLPEGVTVEDTESPDFVHPHPYKVEIERFTVSERCLETVKPQEPQPMTLTPLMMVDTPPQLDGLLEHLKAQTEVAVDLEAHSYRSFQGMTCLMQISTRTHDYIVDTLELRSELYRLNEVFTDPKITKVLHGADSDIVWLQRDFGVYIVNMFDTGQASRVLGFSRYSLAHLMMSYCKVEPDKQFQLADWRIRPLPQELINYAREDTHYLLYIYDQMRNTLIERGNSQANLLRSVYDRSALVATKVYRKPLFTESDALELYKKSKKTFNNQQMTAMTEMFKWRDHMARVEDESYGYVLPNHMLLQMAEILPRERQGVLACCNPIPPLVRQSLPEMHAIIMQAREITLMKIETKPILPMVIDHPKYDADSILNCPHDTSHLDGSLARIEHTIAETGLVATSSSMFGKTCSVPLKTSPSISAFQKIKTRGMKNSVAHNVKRLFSSPFIKFFSSDTSKLIQPHQQDKWKLKPPTERKRKAEDSVNLDTFEPEFVPPNKRMKKETNIGQNVFESTPTSSSSSASQPPKPTSLFQPPGMAASSSLFKPPADVNSLKTSRQTESNVERQIKSLRQEVNSEKKKDKEDKLRKKLKKKQKRSNQHEDSSPASNGSDSAKRMKKDVICVEDSPVSTKVKKEVITIEDSPVPAKGKKDIILVEDSPVSGEVSKKKKKKKKLTIDEVKEQFSSFDYSAAEASLSKANPKKKNVYDSALPVRGGKKERKEMVKKTKLSGAKSNKSFSFDPKPGKN